MPRTCTACTNPHREEIDRRLLEGAPLRNIAKLHSLSPAGVFRHNKHMSKMLSQSRQEAEIFRADGLMEHLNHLTAEAARLKQKAEQKGLPDCLSWGERNEPTVGTGGSLGFRDSGESVSRL